MSKDKWMAMNPVRKGELLEIHVDGASRGNPGPAACAFILSKKGCAPFHQDKEYLGEATNNVAEYSAIISALREAEKWTRQQVKVFSDSQLVIRQINGQYRIKAPHLSVLCKRVNGLISKFERVDFFHVPRTNSMIQKCDALCNECLDEKGL